MIGNVTICANEKAVTNLYFGTYHECGGQNVETRMIEKAFMQLIEYLNGTRKKFKMEFDYEGSKFQLAVWNQLRKIPYGETTTYGTIAHNIDSPKSALAVGRACGKNPIPIFIPCHRVIGSNGDLTGYGGGINLKKKLLEIEAEN